MKRLAPAIIFLTAFTAHAWTPAADHRIAISAARLAPRDLRLLLTRMQPQYLQGVDSGLAEERTEQHREHLRQRIESETTNIVRMIRTGQPMTEVVSRFGVLAHLIGDANNPFHIDARAAVDPAHADFEHYFEERMDRFPVVFYGLDPRLSHVLDQTFARSAKLVPLMNEEYSRGGRRHTSNEFDDRSTAFGVASICYSHAITDLVDADYYIWKEAGGDVRSAPPLRAARVIPNAP